MDLTLLQAGIDATGARQGADQFNKSLDAMAEKAESSMSKIRSSIGKTFSSFTSLNSIIAGVTLAGIVREVADARMELNRIINTLTATQGSAAAASVSFEMLRKTSYQFGQSLPVIARQYTLLSAAAKGTSLEGEGVDKIFKAIVVSSTGLHLSSEQTERSLYAVQHMMSKQVVTAQDLRRQLGNNLPGAMRIAAQAMGVTVVQLNHMLKSGTVLAKDLLPKMSDILIKEYGSAAERAANMTQGLVNQLKTAVFELYIWMGSGGLGAAIDSSLRQITAILRSDDFKQAAATFATLLANGVLAAAHAMVFLMEHAKAVLVILGAFAGLKTIFFFADLAVQVNKAKVALLELEAVQKGISLFSRKGAALTVPDLLKGKNGGLLSQSQLNTRLGGKAFGGLSAYEKVQLAKQAEALGLDVSLSAGTQYAAAASAPLRAGSRAWAALRSGAGGLLGSVAGSKIVQGFRNPLPIPELVETGYRGGAKIPKGLEYLLGKDGKLDMQSAAKKAVSSNMDMGKFANDVSALNTVLSKNGEILNSTAIKTRLAGQAYATMSEEAKTAVRGVTDALGVTAMRSATTGEKFAGMFKGAAFAAQGLWLALRVGAVDAFGAIEAALASNPLTLPIAVALAEVAALIVALYLLRNVQITIGGHTAKIGSFIGVVWDKTVQQFSALWLDATEGFKAIWTSVADHFRSVWDTAVTWFEENGGKRIEAWFSKFNVLRQWAKEAEQREHGGISIQDAAKSTGAVAGIHGDLEAFRKAHPEMFERLPKSALPGRADDDAGAGTPKANPYAQAVEQLRAQIAEYNAILSLQDASKRNLVDINSLYEAQRKIVSLERGGKTRLSAGQKSELIDLELLKGRQQFAAEGVEKASKLESETRSQVGLLQKQTDYYAQLTSYGSNYTDAIYGMNAALAANADVADLVGKVDSARLEQLIALRTEYHKLEAMDRRRSAAALEYAAAMAEGTRLAAASRNNVSDIYNEARKDVTKGYDGFDPTDPRFQNAARKWAEQKVGKDQKTMELDPKAYNNLIQNYVGQYTQDQAEKYAQGLVDFAKQVQSSTGDLNELVVAKGRLDDAMSKGLLDSGAYRREVLDMEKEWDDAINKQIESGNRWEDGILLGMRGIAAESRNTALDIQQAFTSVFQGLQDQMVDFLDTGKFKLKTFVQSLQHEMNTLIVHKISSQIMTAALGSGAPIQGTGNGLGQQGTLTWLGRILGSNGSVRGGGAHPVGTADDPLYVALTTGSGSDFSGLPKSLGGSMTNPSVIPTMGNPLRDLSQTLNAVAKAPDIAPLSHSNKFASGISSLFNSHGVQLAGKAIGNYGYAGLASQANGGGGWGNVLSAFVQGVLGTFAKSGGFGFGGKSGGGAYDQLDMFQGGTGPVDYENSSLTDTIPFAKGGIMTSRGPLQLRKYSGGGIANRPQLAMYGEGSRPEAFVPLPDGKRIPVNVNGGGSSRQNVKVEHTTNIYDQTGRGVQVDQNQQVDGEKYIQEIVIRDIQQEGPMSGALRTYFGK